MLTLENLNIRYINLTKSKKRNSLIKEEFKDYNLIRIPAIDGLSKFSTKEYDKYNRPVWKEEEKQKLVSEGILAEDYRRYYDLVPTETACNMSHVKAWNDFIESKEEYSIFIEDDVKLIKDLSRIEIPDSCEMFYLTDKNHPDERISTYPDGQIKWTKTFMAYVLSRKAAALCIEAAKPFYYQTDLQIPLRLFESYKSYLPNKLPKWKELSRFKAYAAKESYIVLSKESESSTFTKDGKKSWLEINNKII